MTNQNTTKDMSTLEDDYIKQCRAERKYFSGWKATETGMVEVYKTIDKTIPAPCKEYMELLEKRVQEGRRLARNPLGVSIL
jgi:hypothetical protein